MNNNAHVWENKNVRIGSRDKISLKCEAVIYHPGVSEYKKTMTGYCESPNPGVLTLNYNTSNSGLKNITGGMLFFSDDNNSEIFFEIIRVAQASERSISFLVSPKI